MTDKPVSFISGFFRRAVMFFHFKELIAGADPAGLLYRTFTVRAGAFVTLFIMLSALAGAAWTVRKKLNYIPPLFWLLFISVLAVNVITVTSGRYRLAAYPSLFLFAACSTVLLPKKLTAAFAVISAAAGSFLLNGISLDHESVRILGEAAYRKGEFNKALDLLSSVKSRNDDPSGVDNMLGAIYEKRGDTANAAACYRNAIKFEPERYEAYMNLAQITPQPQAADALFREALKRANDSGLLRVNYAKFLLRCGRLQDALEMAKSGVNLLPDAPDAWNTLAVAYAYNNRIRLAADAFEGASRLDPSNMNYRRNAEIMKNELQKRLRMRQQMMLRKNNPR
jgi:Flp pilus assembly protein TadD